jgi:CubicO group peptidase (beta-lactamase class C family)
MKNKIAGRIGRAISENVFPGCVVGWVDKRHNQSVMPFGRFEYAPDSKLMAEDSIFDVASITKSIPTSSLALQLIDAGKLKLEDRVIDYVSSIAFSHREKVFVRHLLSHTLNYGFRLSALKDSGPKGILGAIFSTELAGEPGSTFFYSNATSILLGMVVEKIWGECLAVTAKREIFDPLEMKRTSFFPEEFPRDEIVPTEIDPWRGRTIRAEVHDESAWTLRQIMVAGSAGLFSTVPDILKFLNVLLNRGVWRGTRYFSENCLNLMSTNQTAHLGLQTGLGWELCQARYMGKACSSSTIGKTGFTGCVCMCDLAGGTALTLLSNSTFPSRKPHTKALDEVRREIADIVFSTLNA